MAVTTPFGDSLHPFVELGDVGREVLGEVREVREDEQGLVVGWRANSIALRFSREFLLDMGVVEPTPEEAADAERRLADYRVRVARAWLQYDYARMRLNPASWVEPDPTAQAVLELHQPVLGWHDRRLECHGCEAEGFEWDYPAWPCSTVTAVAAVFGVPLPDAGLLDLPRPDGKDPL